MPKTLVINDCSQCPHYEQDPQEWPDLYGADVCTHPSTLGEPQQVPQAGGRSPGAMRLVPGKPILLAAFPTIPSSCPLADAA